MARLNWSENVTYGAPVLHEPTSVEELGELLATAAPAKALGTRHCFHDIADQPDGAQISLASIPGEVVVDHEAMTATVPAGWSYGRVANALEAEGVALHNLGSLPHISVAGATATATHGSGDTNPILSAAIVGLELVDATGTLRHIGADDPELGALAVGLGAFGVITRMTLRVEPSYQVWQDMYRAPEWDALLGDLDGVMGSAYSVNLHAGFSEATMRLIWRKCRVDAGTDQPETLAGAPLLDPALLPPSNDRTDVGPVGPWSQRLAHFRLDGVPSAGGDELQSEYFVARRHAVDAIEAMRRLGDRVDPHLHGTEIRTVAADDCWISPTAGDDVLSIGLTWKKHPAEVEALLAPIEEALAPFDVRVHPGKLFAMDGATFRERVARYDDFVELVHRWDPDGVFANPYLRRIGVW